jgi:hypothetical protein
MEIQTAEPSVPEPSPSEFEIAISKLKGYKLPGIDQISAELTRAGSETLHSEIHNSLLGIRKNNYRSVRVYLQER